MADRPNVLVPIRVLEGDSLPEGIPELLAHAHVILLGYHVIPEQTATGQARMQFEDRASHQLDELAALFEAAGATVESRVVFTHAQQQTFNRIIGEHDCHAVLVPKATKPPENVIVAVRGTVGAARLADVVAGLFADTDVTVTLYHIAVAHESAADAELLLDGIRDTLVEQGMARDAIVTQVVHGQRPRRAIAESATDYDVIVMGESEPSLATYVFGLTAEGVAEEFLGPVLVVQREKQQSTRNDG